jgi:hypothetical protein
MSKSLRSNASVKGNKGLVEYNFLRFFCDVSLLFCILLLSVVPRFYYMNLFWMLGLYRLRGPVEPQETQRQATQHACLPRAMDSNKVKRCAERKIIFFVSARQPQRTNQGRAPIICPLGVPIHLSFNSQQGPPLYSLSGYLRAWGGK